MESAHIVYVHTLKPAKGVVIYAELTELAYKSNNSYDVSDLFKGVVVQRYSRSFLETRFVEQTRLGAAMTKIRHLERKLFRAEALVQDLLSSCEVPEALRLDACVFVDDLKEYKQTYMAARNRSLGLSANFTHDLAEDGSLPQNYMHTHLEWAGSAKTAYNQAKLHFESVASSSVVPFVLQSKRYYVYTQREYETEAEARRDLLSWTEPLPRKKTVGCLLIKGGGFLFFLPENLRKLV